MFSVLFVLAFGVFGFLRGGELGFDFVVFHRAGTEFLQGLNPWQAAIGSGAPFSYPPHIGSLVAVYGLLPYTLALTIHTALNCGSILLITYFANRWFVGVRNWRQISLVQGFCLAIVLGNPFNAHSVYEGQWTLIATALIFLAWHMLQNNKQVLAGVCLGVATIKPQVALLLVAFLLCRGYFRVLLIGAALALLLMVPTLMSFGLTETFSAWFASMKDYALWPVNQPGSVHVVGMEGVCVSLGLIGTGTFWKCVALVSAVVLAYYRNEMSPILQINFLLASMLTFFYGHDTDFVSMSLLWSYFALLAFRTMSYINMAVAATLLLVIVFPQRFIRVFEIDVLYHTRTFAIAALWVLAYVWEQKLNRINGVERTSDNES